jgi:signal transduction histidine kinase
MGIGITWSIVALMSDTPTKQIQHIAIRSLHHNIRALGLVMEHGGQSAAKRFLTGLDDLIPSPPFAAISDQSLNKVETSNVLENKNSQSRKPGVAPGIGKKRLSWKILVLDTQGIELLKRPVPTWAKQVPIGADNILTQSVISSTGKQYSIVARIEIKPEWKTARRGWLSLRLIRDLFNNPKRLGIALVAGVLMSALACFLLSWYITQPVKKLRAATRRLSSGNFDVRVAQAIGRRNDEISELGWDFDRMADRIQALIASKQGLLDDVSHEFRSPLARLQVAVGLARHKAPNALTPEVERIEREIHRLDNLVGQVLMLSRLDADAMEGCHDYVDLPALLEDIVRDAEFEASSKNRHICIIQNLGECTFKANVSLLHRALENVIRNAVKYTHEGTAVELILDKDEQQTDWVKIQVCDQGSGVPKAMLPKLFDVFFRAESGRERETGGYGLGLSIAQRAIQVHGGEIQAQNRTEGGLCIIIRLPIR